MAQVTDEPRLDIGCNLLVGANWVGKEDIKEKRKVLGQIPYV